MHAIESLRVHPSLAQLVELFRQYGYAAELEPLPSASGFGTAAVLARHGSFRILGIEVSRDPVTAARREARELYRRTERGLVTAIAPRSGRVALAAWRADRDPIVRSVDLHRLGAPERDLFERLRPRVDESPLALHFRITAALEAEGVSQRFVAAFRRTLDEFTHRCPLAVQQADARVLALTALIRVLFLYFVQAKGWLNGEPDYLCRRLHAALAARDSFHDTVLDPLVFGALSAPRGRRTRPESIGQVPFLNGGLFERTAPERRHGTPAWPNAVWRRAFDALFDRFHFSVRESGRDDAIEPDMLGRVFEAVMDRERRRSTGAYYTPHRLVARVLELALLPLLARRAGLPRSMVRAALRGAPPVEARARRLLLEAVRHITLLDPAVGSGAFLLGALERLTALHQTLLDPHSPSPHRLRRAILRRNLYGVDIDLVAVHLAELRLWLAIIADDPTATPGGVAPLPNLDGVVRQGDSLLDPLTRAAGSCIIPGASAGPVRAEVARVAEVRRSLFAAVGSTKRRTARTLRRAEVALARRLFAGAADDLERQIRALLHHARRPSLFGAATGLEAADRKRLQSLRARRREARSAIRRLQTRDELPFFSFELNWPDVLSDGGFDLVVGNPPWVRGERLTGALRRALASRYRTFQTTKRGYTHAPDLAQAFVERALELAAAGGVIALLIPSKLTTAGYAAPLRAVLGREATIERLWRIEGGRRQPFRATVYPLALIASKVSPSPIQRRRYGAGPWIVLDRRERALIEALTASPHRIDDRWPARLGVKSGANAIFLGRLTGGAFTSLGGLSGHLAPANLRPALRGRDITAFGCESELSIVWTHGPFGEPLSDLPPDLLGYLSPLADQLTRRADARGAPYWSLFRTAAARPVARTVWSDLARDLTAVALPHGSRLAPLNTCYVILHEHDDDALALSAFLNSTPVRWLARGAADEARGGYHRFNARVVGRLPLPPLDGVWHDLAALARRAHRTRHDPRSIDDLVASAFGLDAVARAALDRVAGPLR